MTTALMPVAFRTVTLPAPLQAPLRLLCAVRYITKSAEEIQFYSSHAHLFVGGRIFQRVFRDTPGIPAIAQTILITTTILKTTEKTLQLKATVGRLIDVVFGTFGSPTLYFQQELTQKPMTFRKNLFLFSFTIHLPPPIADIAIRIEEIALTVIALVVSLWELACALMDLLDAFLLDSADEAMLGIGANVVRAYKSLTNNGYFLAQECEKHEQTIDGVLQFCGSQMKAKEFIPIIKQKAEELEWAENAASRGLHEVQEKSLDAHFDFLLAHTGYANSNSLSGKRSKKVPYYPIRSAHDTRSHTAREACKQRRFYNIS